MTDERTIRVTASMSWPFTDAGNALRVAHYLGDDLRYDKYARQWFHWDQRRWLRATDADMIKVGRTVARNVAFEAALRADDDPDRGAHWAWAKRTASARGIADMIKLATGEPALWRSSDEFDREPYLVNFRDGTVDVRTKVRRPHDRDDWLTGLVDHDYDPDATAPMFEGMVERTFQVGGTETAEYVQRALGYALLGRNPEQKIFFIVGDPNCGKSKLVEVVGKLLGRDYTHKAKTELLAKTKRGHHASETFSLIGRRFVTISETSSSFSLDESFTKELTGDSVVATRKLHVANEVNTDISWTIFLVSNEFPEVGDWDDALKRRVVVVPAGPSLKPAEVQPDLDARILADEAGGVLRWLVDGAHSWWREYQRTDALDTELTSGLTSPFEVARFTERYGDEVDWMAKFIREQTEPDTSGVRHAKSVFFARCKAWRGVGEIPRKQKLYKRIAEQPGVKVDDRSFMGIKLRQEFELIVDQ